MMLKLSILFKEAGARKYRVPLAVSKIIQLRNGDMFSVCPRCSMSLEREYQAFCDRCGQRLDWRFFDSAEIIFK